jgi:hypothetical protein
MPEASITTEIHKPFDVHGNFGAKFPFYLEFVIDYLADAVDLSFGEIVCVGIGINLEFVKDPIGSRSSDTVNIGQTDFYPFTSR